MRPEVAELYELSPGVTRVHVASLGRDYDLTRITLQQAEQLVAAGCTRIRRKPAATKDPRAAKRPASAKQPPAQSAGPTVDAVGPAEGKE